MKVVVWKKRSNVIYYETFENKNQEYTLVNVLEKNLKFILKLISFLI